MKETDGVTKKKVKLHNITSVFDALLTTNRDFLFSLTVQ